MENKNIDGLLLIDCEPSQGKPFILRKEIREHLEKNKAGKTVKISDIDEESLSRIREAERYMTTVQKTSFGNYRIVSGSGGFFIQNEKKKIVTNGDFAILKIKFKKDINKNIIDVTANNPKELKNSSIETVLKKIKEEYTSTKNCPLAGTNVQYDISHLKFILTIAYALANENIEKSAFIDYMGMINSMEVVDTRHSFIDAILNPKVSEDSMDGNIHRAKYIDYCISEGHITSSLNLITKQEIMLNFTRKIEHGLGFIEQKHTAVDDVKDLANLIKNLVLMLYESDMPLNFSSDGKKVEKSSYQNISLKYMIPRLKSEGYLIYNGNLKQIENLTDADIDSIEYVPTRAYADDPPELKKIINVDMKSPKGNNLEYFKKLFKEMTKVRKTTTVAEKYQHGIVTGITKVTLDNLIEADIKEWATLSDERRIGRIKFILYYFLEQQKAIMMMKSLNEVYKKGRVVSLDNKLVVSYSKLIGFIKANSKAVELFREEIKDSNSKIDIAEVLKKYTLALTRAIATEKLEYEASIALTKASSSDDDGGTRKGGVYYEKKKTEIADTSTVGYDSILWSNGNGLSLYFGFFPGRSFLYISFKRNKGSGYKSYLYNGLDYIYYHMILKSVKENRSIGKTVWRLLREIRAAVQHRSVVKAENKGKITKKSRYFETVSGEEGVYRKDEEAEGIDFGMNADEQNSKMTEQDAQLIAGTLFVKAFFQEASTIRKR